MTLKKALLCSTLIAAAPAIAEEKRELDAHMHGHGALNIALDGETLALELIAPGFDIVGFEHAAESDADKAAVDAGLAKLSDPVSLFGVPTAANCTVTSAEAELHSEDEHHEDEHDDHAHDDHDDHGDKHDDHDHDKEHAEHDDHDHEEHEKEHADHDEHDHDKEEHAEHDAHDHDAHDHGDEATHSEFHAEYALTCANPAELTSLSLAYFAQFPNAEELEVQLVTDAGATKVEVTADASVVTLN